MQQWIDSAKKQKAAPNPMALMARGGNPKLAQIEVAMRMSARHFRGKRVLVFGSTAPRIESMLFAHGAAEVHTVEFIRIDTDFPSLHTWRVADLHDALDRHCATTACVGASGPRALDVRERRGAGGAGLQLGFDFAVSTSSFDHTGLGRYGDPICPDGDLLSMQDAMDALRPGGRMLLTVPVGPDAVAWNLHRRYGRQRLPRLLAGWEEERRLFLRDGVLDATASITNTKEPVFLLRKPEVEGAAGGDL